MGPLKIRFKSDVPDHPSPTDTPADGRDTCTVAVTMSTAGAVPCTLPLLLRPAPDPAIMVPKAALQAVRCGIPSFPLEGLNPEQFCREAAEAVPLYGAGNNPGPRHQISAAAMRAGGYVMVPQTHVLLGMNAVDPQRETWTCGLNSGARFAAMLGQPIHKYQDFVARSPYNFDFLGIPRVGPEPHQLCQHLRSQNALLGSDIGERCTDDWNRSWEVIAESLQLGRPAIALMVWCDTSMHYVNIVGWQPQTRRVAFIDTDGGLYNISLDQLKYGMYGSQTWLRRLGRIGDYNTITCTLACPRKNDILDEDFYRSIHPDLAATHAQQHLDKHGLEEGRISAPWFDISYYRQRYPQYRGMRPQELAAHYLCHGIERGERASLIFDPIHYLSVHRDLTDAFGANNYRAALRHYMESGHKESRDLSREFNPQRYLTINDDVRRILGSDPMVAVSHYYRYGRFEGRTLG